jgi:hypothetical protein
LTCALEFSQFYQNNDCYRQTLKWLKYIDQLNFAQFDREDKTIMKIENLHLEPVEEEQDAMQTEHATLLFKIAAAQEQLERKGKPSSVMILIHEVFYVVFIVLDLPTHRRGLHAVIS